MFLKMTLETLMMHRTPQLSYLMGAVWRSRSWK